jgi:N-acetylglutamate synthase-like GNAT family acetyltransferase
VESQRGVRHSPPTGRMNSGIRIAEAADIAAITAVINAAFGKAEAFFIERDRVGQADVRSFLEKGRFLVVDRSGTLAGCVYLELRGPRAYLGLLSVDPEQQKSGLGTRLMEAAESFAAQAGCRFMDLRTVNLRTDNRAFYRRHGYLEAGTEPFPAELETKLPCHFVNLSKPLR